ncbi:MAG: ABC transporter permease [Acetobacteraceae bacterium]|nr:ABC transporter permease [Acetobacteraceae bacterium]
MSFVVLQALTGLAGASSLFLLSAGLTVIFGVTRVVNFAHGGLYMLGAYVGWTIMSALPPGLAFFIAGAVVTAAAVGVLGAAVEMTFLRRIYRAPSLFQLLATFGALLLIEEFCQRVWGAEDHSLTRAPWMRGAVPIGGTLFPVYDLALVAVGPAVLLGLWLLFSRTRWGTLVRAATQDREMVGALGVDQRRLFTTVFALGAALAGLGGALALPDRSANLQMDLGGITDAFVVVVVGGLGSVPGAYLAAVLIGEMQAFGIVLIPQATLVLAFAVMALVLALRPNGLLGRPIEEARVATAALIRPSSTAGRVAAAVAVVAAVLAPFYVGPYGIAVLTEAAIAVLFAGSLHVMMGPGGMPSFGHAAFFAIGAYAAALTTRAGGPMLPSIAGAMLLASLVAAALGLFVARLSGVYLAMLTLAFAQIVWAVTFQWVGLTGGDNGLLNIWPASWAAGPAPFYWLALALCLGGMGLLRRALFAPFGYALRGARDSQLRADAVGLSPFHLRVVAFALAGGGAGLAGGVFAFAKGGVFPSYADIPRSVDALLMVLLGGLQTMAGPIVGALFYTGLYDLLLQATDLWRLFLGLAIILLVLVFPLGILGSIQGWTTRRAAA